MATYTENQEALNEMRAQNIAQALNKQGNTTSSTHKDYQGYLNSLRYTNPQIAISVPKRTTQTKTVSYDPVKFAALKQALMKPKAPQSGMEIFAENLANIPEAQGFKGGFGEDIYNPYGVILGGLMRGFGQGYSQRKAAEREAADRKDELALRLAQLDYENSKRENLFKSEDEIKTLNQGSGGQGYTYLVTDENGNVIDTVSSNSNTASDGMTLSDGTKIGLGLGGGASSAKEAQAQFQTMEGLHNAALNTSDPSFQNANEFAGQFQTNRYNPEDKDQGWFSRKGTQMLPGVDYGFAKSINPGAKAMEAENKLKNKYHWNLDAFKANEPELAEKLDMDHARTTAFEYINAESLPMIAKYGSLFKPMSDTDIQAVLKGAGLTPLDTAETRETKLVQAILRGTGISAGGVKTFEDLRNVAANMGVIAPQYGTQSLVEQPVQQPVEQPMQTPVQQPQANMTQLYKPNSSVNYGGTKTDSGYAW